MPKKKKKLEKMSNKELEEKFKTSTIPSVSTDVTSSEEAQAKAIMQLTESPNPEVLTHLTDFEIKKLASLSAVANKYNLTVVKEWITTFIRYRISMNRKGREEIVDIAKTKGQQQMGDIRGLRFWK